jgi:hypothetical protein
MKKYTINYWVEGELNSEFIMVENKSEAIDRAQKLFYRESEIESIEVENDKDKVIFEL